MSFPILEQYTSKFPDQTSKFEYFSEYYNKKLWNELTMEIMEFIYDPNVKGKITFEFYTEFIKRFQKNIDQINLLKIIKQSLASQSKQDAIDFLIHFEDKEAGTEEIKIMITGMMGYYYTSLNMKSASECMQKVKTYIDSKKDVDSFAFSVYHKLCYTYYANKRKFKLFYNSALQFLAYTSAQEIEENEKLKLLFEMGISVLVSEQIYNFSQLLEQPLLLSLKSSPHSWLYTLLEIFNKGDIKAYQKAALEHEELKKNVSKLQQKVKLMAFLELSFNLPKNNRVIGFDNLSKVCGVPLNNVEFMVMKAMALNLVKGSIDQIKKEVTISWVAPKVLEKERIGTMLKKFEQWEEGINGVQDMIQVIKVQ